MDRLILLLATNGGLGFARVAPGTVGTLAGIPAFYLLAGLGAPGYLAACLALIGAAGRIVIDELAGYLVTVALLPFSWTAALLGFFWFRLFDIFKLPPASWIDRRLKNGAGVVLDDLVAGVYAAILLRITLRLLA